MSTNFYKKAEFIKSITSLKEAPQKKLIEVLFVGKSNVGKSSLINSLTNNKKLAYTSSKPGHTRLLNYYLIEDSFYFVDAPGYGFSARKDGDYVFYDNIIEKYFDSNDNLKLIIFLLDSRRKPNDDDDLFYKFMQAYEYPHLIVMTKCDKLNMSMKAKIKTNLEDRFGEINYDNLLMVSINDKLSVANLKEKINQSIGYKGK